MQAIINERYGSPADLKLKDIPRPVPADGEVLIKVMATGLNGADRYILRGKPLLTRFTVGLLRPRHTILGADVAGIVEAVGAGVTRFRPGDAVFGDLSGSGFGGLAEYVAAPEAELATKPAGLPFVEAAAVPMAAVTALQGLRDIGGIQSGQRVLVYGASGGVGTYAVQIAKAYGAEVTAVCSTAKVDQARALGADHVIDYTREDFSRNGSRYDLILAANGNLSLSDYARALTPTGVLAVTGGRMSQIFRAILLGPIKSKSGGQSFRNLLAKPNAADLAWVAERITAGHVRPVIERCYPLHETAEAMRHLETGHLHGKIVVVVAQGQEAAGS